ncbi:MAG TPA: ABC transporter permease [Bacteroidia bacterium]|nr:ABC transporter permease [Bacteroidia bacterium]
MFDSDKWQEIFSTLGKNKLRTFLTAFSVAWGIFILIILLAAGQGLKNGVNSQFGNDAANSIWIDGGLTSVAYAGYKPGRVIQLTNDDFRYVKERVKGVDRVSAVYRGWETKMLGYKKVRAGFTVRSCAPDHDELERAKVIKGRFIDEIDFEEYKKVCVIGVPVQEALFKDEDPINKYIDVAGIPYKVVGVFSDPGRGDNERIYVPLSTMQRVNNGKHDVNVIWASTGSLTVEQSQQAANQIRMALAHKYHFDPDDKNALGLYNNNVEYKRVMGMLNGIKLFVLIIGIFTLMAGIVGVSNIMMIVVKERISEIGVRKALGATPFSIVALIIQESVFITSIAGYTGFMLGFGLVEALKAAGLEGDFFKNPEIDLAIALGAVGLIVLSGALAGFFPAMKAARIQPVEALREN